MLGPERLLIDSLHCVLDAVQARNILPSHLPDLPQGCLHVIGAGKAAAAMAAVVEAHYPADATLSGVVLTRYGHAEPTTRIPVIEAGHPLPDHQGECAAARVQAIVRQAQVGDSLLVLLSGGASSLLTMPEAGLELSGVQAATRELLRSGAPIGAINCVRKHLSSTLGGKLAEACLVPSRVLIISDVVGDDPSVIASGPFHPDPSTFEEALDVLHTWDVRVPATVTEFLMAGMLGRQRETIKPGAACFGRVDTRVIANAHTALAAAMTYFKDNGIAATIMEPDEVDEARTVAARHAQLVRAHIASGKTRPIALISGGETCVKVTGNGRGGRNGEYILALAHHLNGIAGVYALAADTDGIDGTEDNAGALLTPAIWARAEALDLSAAEHLSRNDAYGYFSALEGLVVTGATRTNVNDYRVILIT